MRPFEAKRAFFCSISERFFEEFINEFTFPLLSFLKLE